MDRLEFDCICELAEIMDNYVATNTSENEYPIISAYGDYEVAKALVETLIRFGNPIGDILELEDYEMSHYNKEYVVYLTEGGVTAEKIWHKDCYYNGGGDISFVYEDCNSKLLKHIDSKIRYEFAVGKCEDDEECDFDECCGCCEYNEDDNTECIVKSDDDGYSITVKCNLDADEAMKVIKDMENRMERMNDMFDRMYQSSVHMFSRLRW